MDRVGAANCSGLYSPACCAAGVGCIPANNGMRFFNLGRVVFIAWDILRSMTSMIGPITRENTVSQPATIPDTNRDTRLKCIVICAAVWLILLGLGYTANAADAKKSDASPVSKMRKNDLTPIPDLQKPVSAHSPYQDGDCSVCHQRKDRNDPGMINKPVNELCLDCHDDFAKVMARKSSHVPAKLNCVSCHNPHNARQPHLLVEESETLCLSCHTAISNLVTNAKVKHDALGVDHKCANCHNPHAANVEHLLTRLPFDLCVGVTARTALRITMARCSPI